MSKFKRLTALMLALIMCLAYLPAPASASSLNDLYAVNGRVTLDGANDNTVTIAISIDGSIGITSFQGTWSTTETEGFGYLTMTDIGSDKMTFTGMNDVEPETGYMIWVDDTYENPSNFSTGEKVVYATYRVAANTPAGVYTVEFVPEYISDEEWNEYYDTFTFKITVSVEAAPACNHEGTKTNVQGVKEAGCTEDGYTGDTYCECGEKIATGTSIPAGHKAGEPAKENEVPASCGQGGSYDWVTRCSVCNEVITSEPKTTTATGNHVDQGNDHKCDSCGGNVGTHASNAEHPCQSGICEYCGNPVAATENHVDTKGKDHSCDVCGAENVTEHTAGEPVIETTPASCTEEGKTVTETFCTKCGERTSHTESSIPVDNNAHTWGATSYGWNSDRSAYEATHVCQKSENHKETEKATVTSKKIENETCGVAGKTEYTAVFNVDWADKKVWTEDLPGATGNHTYDNACDAECNVCKATREVGNHVYDNACDADCNECGATREVGNHVYDNDCDADCNECGATRKVDDHVYDNACDADCNECGATRVASDHVYDNDCDAECNVCKATREVGDHVYEVDTTKGTDGYEWAEDYSTCTAYGVCSCGDTTSETVNAKYTKKADATCTSPEYRNYTADFKATWAEDQGGDFYDPTGAVNSDNHSSNGFMYENNLNGTHKKLHACCQAVVKAEEKCTFDQNYECTVCGNSCGHKDAAKDHICDYGCGKIDIGTHESNAEHPCEAGKCDYCNADMAATAGHTGTYSIEDNYELHFFCNVCEEDVGYITAEVETVTDEGDCQNSGFTTDIYDFSKATLPNGCEWENFPTLSTELELPKAWDDEAKILTEAFDNGENPEKHPEESVSIRYESNEDGTHKVISFCGACNTDVEVIDTSAGCYDENGDNQCDDCGYVIHVCGHDRYEYIANKEHASVCTCGRHLAYFDHTAGEDGYCICGGWKFTIDFDGILPSTTNFYNEPQTHSWDQVFFEKEFTKEGYTFAGFAYDKEGKDRLEQSAVISGPTTIYVAWNPKEYTVTFTINGVAYGEPVPVKFGEAVLAPAYTIPEGHSFSGWSVPETMPAENITLNATLTVNEYELTIQYRDADGAWTEKTMTVLYGSVLEELDFIKNLQNVNVDDDENVGTYELCGSCAIGPSTDDLVGNDLAGLTMPAYDAVLDIEYLFTGWWHDVDGWEYEIENETQKTGWTEINDAWYYLDTETGIRAEGLTRVPYPTEAINGITYAPNAEDLAYAESKGQTFIDKDTAQFVFGEDGKFLSDLTDKVDDAFAVNGMIPWHVGMVKIGDDYYYFCGDEVNGGNKAYTGFVYATREYNSGKPVGSDCVYYFGADGKLVAYEGIEEVEATLYYFDADNKLDLSAGLVEVEVDEETKYIYVRSSGKLVVDAEYWVPANSLNIVPGMYEFDENGYMIQPEMTDKNGIIAENGGLFFYENGKLAYNKGLFEFEGHVIYVRSNGQLAVGEYYVTNVDNYNGTDVKSGDKVCFDDNGFMMAAKNGIVDGKYYVDGNIAYNAGVVEIGEGKYIYVRSNGEVVIGRSYWITNVGETGIVAKQYTFDENGIMLNPEFKSETVLNGIVDGYYYVDGKIAYCAGVVELTDEAGETFYIYVRSNGSLATGVYWPTNTNGLLKIGAYNWGADGKLYI